LIYLKEKDFKVEKTRNVDEIASIAFHDEIWPKLTNPKTPKTKDIFKNKNGHFYIFKNNAEELMGIVVFSIIAPNLHIVDIGSISKFRGSLIYKCGSLALKMHEEIFNKPIILGQIRLSNKQSLHFALKHGFKIIATDNHYFHVEKLEE